MEVLLETKAVPSFVLISKFYLKMTTFPGSDRNNVINKIYWKRLLFFNPLKKLNHKT
jgi:hypothetical protein